MQPINETKAGVVELVDTLDLGSSAARCEGSSPFTRTEKSLLNTRRLFLFPIVKEYCGSISKGINPKSCVYATILVNLNKENSINEIADQVRNDEEEKTSFSSLYYLMLLNYFIFEKWLCRTLFCTKYRK